MPSQDIVPGCNGAALIIEGGALRGIFSTGVLDGFLESGFNPFDLCIGVSSGATNLAAYLAGMTGRNEKIYTDYSLRREFINFPRFLRGGHLLDLDWLWDITIRENRLDLEAIYATGKSLIVVTTDILTGQAYYKKTGPHDLEHVLKASSAMPLFYRDFPEVDGRRMTDGGIADAIPIREAIRRGARRIMVVRSRHHDYFKRHDLFERIMGCHISRYPALRQAILGRVEQYNESVSLIRTPPPGISIVEVCPPKDFQVSRLTRQKCVLEEGYRQGRGAAGAAVTRWAETN